MSKEEKLINRCFSFPGDFTFEELIQVLSIFGFVQSKSGRTSGSRCRFVNNSTGDKFIFHRPHPNNIVKRYVLKELYEMLREGGYIK